MSKLAVFLKFRNAEIHRAVIGFVCQTSFEKPLDKCNHFGNMFRGRRVMFGRFYAQSLEIGEKRIFILPCVLAQRHVVLHSAADRFVVHVS